jgi:hypothetical protein
MSDQQSTVPAKVTSVLPEGLRALNGWKEIADFLGRGVRTVQRWESQGLPIHRPNSHRRSAVVAIREELSVWISASPQLSMNDVIFSLRKRIVELETENAALRLRLIGETPPMLKVTAA